MAVISLSSAWGASIVRVSSRGAPGAFAAENGSGRVSGLSRDSIVPPMGGAGRGAAVAAGGLGAAGFATSPPNGKATLGFTDQGPSVSFVGPLAAAKTGAESGHGVAGSGAATGSARLGEGLSATTGMGSVLGAGGGLSARSAEGVRVSAGQAPSGPAIASLSAAASPASAVARFSQSASSRA